MTYCRWSSDNFKSDVYCYESNQGFLTHVVSDRIFRLPDDGKTFIDADAAGMLATLLRLRATGYHVPDHAIETLREEAGR